MAVPRNQVAVSGFVDPYAKLSGTFSDLSKVYSDKAANEALTREKVLVRAEDARRWDVENNRANSELAKQEALKKAVWNTVSGNNTYNLDAYSPQLREQISRSRDLISSQDSLATSYLTSTDDNKELLNTISKNYRDMYQGSGLNETALDNKVAENVTRLKALRREVSSISDPEKIENRIREFRERQFTTPLNNIDEAVQRGTALTKDQKIAYQLRALSPEQRALVDPIALKTALGESVEGPTKQDMLASENARVEKIEKNRQQNIDNLLKWADETGFDRQKAFGPSATSAAEKIMDGLDIGRIDTPNADAFYRTLVAEGVAPVFAANYTMGKIDTNLFGSSFVSPTSREGAAQIAEAIAQYSALESKYNNSGKLTRGDIEVTTIAPRSFDQLQYANFKVPNSTTPIQVAERFLRPPVPQPSVQETPKVPVLPPSVLDAAPDVTKNLLGGSPERANALRMRRETQEAINSLTEQLNNLPSGNRGNSARRIAEKTRIEEQIRTANSRMAVIREALRGRNRPTVITGNSAASRL